MSPLNKKTWIKVPCPTCRGSGRRGNRKYPLCKGTKTILVPPLNDKDE